MTSSSYSIILNSQTSILLRALHTPHDRPTSNKAQDKIYGGGRSGDTVD